jgi:hypothetical protein
MSSSKAKLLLKIALSQWQGSDLENMTKKEKRCNSSVKLRPSFAEIDPIHIRVVFQQIERLLKKK